MKMDLGRRLKELRSAQNLSQGDIQDKTGLLRCYVSRVENGHTMPNLDTLERWAGALGVELYQLFFEGDHPVAPPVKPGKVRSVLSPSDRKAIQQLQRLASRLRV